MRRRAAAVLCLSLLGLTGCWDNRPIESRAMVLVMGVDPGPHGDITLSVQLPSPEALQSVTGTSPPVRPTSFVLTSQGKRFADALDGIQAASEHEVYLGQIQAVVLSTHLSDAQFKEVEDFLSRYGPTDKSAYLVATEERAADILSFQPKGARFPALYLHILFSCKTCQVAHLERMVWDQEKMRLSPAADAWMPLLATDGDFHIDRIVVYDRTHPAMILTPAETITFADLLGLTHKAVESVPTRWGPAGLRSVRAIPTSRARLEAGKLVADISVKVSASLDTYPLGAATLSNVRAIESALSQRLAESSTALIAKFQRRGLNPLRLGESVLWHHPELAPRWKALYHDARITVHVSSHITDVGDAM